MSHYKPYPAYKDSGIEWIGKVPEDWTVQRMRHVATFTNSNVDKKAYIDQDIVSLCNYTDVYYNEFITSDHSFMQATASQAEIKQFSLRKGDVLITKDSEDPADIGIPSLIVENMPGVICGYHLTLIRTPDLVTARLLHRVLQAQPTKAHFFVEAPGITRYGLGQDTIGNLTVCFPPQEHREAVVNRIDRETARIDALIAKKTRFIKLLKEKRQSLITHAVTKGLDSNVKMKDSGVEWIGKVPEHWLAVKFNRVARVTEGLVDPKDEKYRNMLLLAPNHIESGTGKILDLETAAEQKAESGKYTCKQGAVVYSKIRPALAKVAIAPCDCLCSADMYPMDCTEYTDPEWLFYLMLSPPFTAWAVLESDRVAMPKINRESLSALEAFIPPKVEQKDSVRWLKTQLSKVDLLSDKTQHSIDLLKERRSAFITAAITGKIDVRNVNTAKERS